MKTLSDSEADRLFDKYWDEMGQEWFKLEVLQDYSAEDDSLSLRSWYRGDKQKSIEQIKASEYREWIESCQKKLEQGVKLIRLHVVNKPYSPYIKWELEHYRYVNVPKCGEQVYLVDKADISVLELPHGDVMIFDRTRAVVNAYNPQGLVISQTFYDESDDISQLLELVKKLKKLAQPMHDFS